MANLQEKIKVFSLRILTHRIGHRGFRSLNILIIKISLYDMKIWLAHEVLPDQIGLKIIARMLRQIHLSTPLIVSLFFSIIILPEPY